jgi:hypothetical protein
VKNSREKRGEKQEGGQAGASRGPLSREGFLLVAVPMQRAGGSKEAEQRVDEQISELSKRNFRIARTSCVRWRVCEMEQSMDGKFGILGEGRNPLGLSCSIGQGRPLLAASGVLDWLMLRVSSVRGRKEANAICSCHSRRQTHSDTLSLRANLNLYLFYCRFHSSTLQRPHPSLLLRSNSLLPPEYSSCL